MRRQNRTLRAWCPAMLMEFNRYMFFWIWLSEHTPYARANNPNGHWPGRMPFTSWKLLCVAWLGVPTFRVIFPRRRKRQRKMLHHGQMTMKMRVVYLCQPCHLRNRRHFFPRLLFFSLFLLAVRNVNRILFTSHTHTNVEQLLAQLMLQLCF